MATDLNLQVAGIKDDYKYGFRDSVETTPSTAARDCRARSSARSPR